MRVLFVYRYLTTGGVEAVLRARLDGLNGSLIEGHAWFLERVDGLAMFQGTNREPYIGDLPMLEAHLRDKRYQAISVIDTPEVFPLLKQVSRSAMIFVEAHSPYLENLEYLRSLDGLEIASIIVPSRFQASLVKKRLRREIPVLVLPNPLRANFTTEPLGFKPRPTRPILAWVGRLDSLKNWLLAIKTASNLKRRGRDFELWVAGRLTEPATSDHLYRAAKRNDILNILRWFDNFPHDRMHRWLDAVRESGGVVISTSKGESFGMAIAEAMARKCAVVVPDVGPFREFINANQTGIFYKPESMKDIASKVDLLLENASQRESLGSAARASILEKHSSEVALNAMARSFEEVLGHSRSTSLCDD
jgi:glycosyltransferase involved in cell wall biosynthesis